MVVVGVMLFAGALSKPQLAGGAEGTCAVWAEQLKCWGMPEYYDPHHTPWASTELVMRPPADPFYLGQNFTPSQVIAGFHLNCAVSVDGAVRCWGLSPHGVGYGNTFPFRYNLQ